MEGALSPYQLPNSLHYRGNAGWRKDGKETLWRLSHRLGSHGLGRSEGSKRESHGCLTGPGIRETVETTLWPVTIETIENHDNDLVEARYCCCWI